LGILQFSQRKITHTQFDIDRVSGEKWQVCRFEVPYRGVWDAERAQDATITRCLQWWKTDFRTVKITNVTVEHHKDGNDRKITGGTFVMTVVLVVHDNDMRVKYGLTADI